MTVAQFYRINGRSILLGAILFTVHIVLRSLVTAGLDPATFALQSSWIQINAVGVIGAALVLLGLPVLYTKLAARSGWLGLFGVALIALAWMFFGLFLSLYSVLVAPWLAAQVPALAAAALPSGILIAYLTALVSELVGCVLLAIPFFQGRLQPRWVGYALPGAAILTVVGTLLAPSGPAANLAINLLSNTGPMLLMAALGYLGFQMGSNHISTPNARRREANREAVSL
ncbi:MAG: hypothetical protein U0175_34115 [Caldilineaceae bacterium]